MKMNRRTLLATGASAATLATLGLPVRAQEPLKIGFIYVGPVGDGGWTYQHDQGRLAVEEHFGDAVETIYQSLCPRARTPSGPSRRWCWRAAG
jgi:simple sugar transport system substrate-binding protein